MCELIILSRRELCYVTNTLFVKWWTTIKSDGQVLEIEFGPPHADFGFIWSPQIDFWKTGVVVKVRAGQDLRKDFGGGRTS